MKLKKIEKRAKEYGISKGTRRLIIKQALMKGSVTKPELMKAIPNVMDRGIRRELAKLRSMGIVLTVISSSGGAHSNTTVISLNHRLAEAFENYGEFSPKQIEMWSWVLVVGDSVIRRFLTKSNGRSNDVRAVKSRLRNLLDGVLVDSPAEVKLRNEVRGILEGIADKISESVKENHHARAANGPSRNRQTLNQRRPLRQQKPSRHSLRNSQAASQEGTNKSLPGGWLQKGRRAVQRVGEIISRRVDQALGGV